MRVVDAWHGTLLGCISTLGGVIAAMWRHGLKRQRQHDQAMAGLQRKLDDSHADHIADVKELTQETIELARAATYAPPLKRSASLPPDSTDSETDNEE